MKESPLYLQWQEVNVRIGKDTYQGTVMKVYHESRPYKYEVNIIRRLTDDDPYGDPEQNAVRDNTNLPTIYAQEDLSASL